MFHRKPWIPGLPLRLRRIVLHTECGIQRMADDLRVYLRRFFSNGLPGPHPFLLSRVQAGANYLGLITSFWGGLRIVEMIVECVISSQSFCCLIWTSNGLYPRPRCTKPTAKIHAGLQVWSQSVRHPQKLLGPARGQEVRLEPRLLRLHCLTLSP